MRNYSHSPRFRSCHYPRKLDVLIASQIRVGGAVSGGGLRAKSHNDGNVPFPRPRRHLFLPHPYLSPLPPPPASSPPSLPPSLISEKKKINITYLAFANVTRHHSQPKEHKAVSVPTTTQTNDADVRAAAEPRCLPPAFAKEQPWAQPGTKWLQYQHETRCKSYKGSSALSACAPRECSP